MYPVRGLYQFSGGIRRHGTEIFNPETARNLTCGVFGFQPAANIPQTIETSNFYHHEALKRYHSQLHDVFPGLNDINHIRELIGLLKIEFHTTVQNQKTVQELHDYLKTIPLPVSWIPANIGEAALDQALQFVLSLWLFAEPKLDDRALTLKQAVHASFNSIKTASNKWLWEDFCAETLASTAAFRFVYTHKLAEHLTFASRSEIRVFCHTRVLRRYAEPFTPERYVDLHGSNHEPNVEPMSDEYSSWYPDALLRDHDRTMNLLWPMEKTSVNEHINKLQRRDNVDLEASLGHENKFDLRTYPFFGDRLAKIQERLEIEQRQRTGTTAFRIAIWGIVLTAFFGLVSAATGLASMWAGLKQVGAI